MAAVLPTVVPVFGLILLGFLAGRTGYLSEAGIKGLPEFVFRIAMPVMLFKTIGQATLPSDATVAIVGAVLLAIAVVWLLTTILTRLALGRSNPDAAALSMAATFSNTVMMGVPICLSHFGPEAASIIALILLFDTVALWLAGTLHLTLAQGTAEQPLGRALANVVKSLLSNPIILGMIAGLAWQVSGLTLPPLARGMIDMLAAAAIPGALVAMGLALNSYGLGGQAPAVVGVTVLKLLVLPATTAAIAGPVLGLPPLAAGVIVVLTAMPVGANAYLFAAAYGRAPAAVSGAIALSTPLSLITISALLLWLGSPAR
jgi:predicted permease